MSRTLFLVAGEHSGDQRGAELIRALREKDPSLEFAGLGGSLMAEAGCTNLFDLPSLAVLGFTDVIRTYGTFRRIFHEALARIEVIRPQAVVLIDFPGFNIRLAKKIKKRFPVIYYVSPQVWAWAPRRKYGIARCVHKMLTLFRFEENVYRGTSLDTEWVGHPLVDQLRNAPGAREARLDLSIPELKTVVGLFPGSRAREVKRILPVMLDAARLIQKHKKDALFLISQSPTVDDSYINDALRARPDVSALVKKGDNPTLLRASDFALVCSGTATLEAALLEIPFLLVYKTAYLTYLFARNLLEIPYIGIANVLSGKMIVPEFVQHYAKARPIAECALHYLDSGAARQEMKKNLSGIRNEVGWGGASGRAAEAVIKLLNSNQISGDASAFKDSFRSDGDSNAVGNALAKRDSSDSGVRSPSNSGGDFCRPDGTGAGSEASGISGVVAACAHSPSTTPAS